MPFPEHPRVIYKVNPLEQVICQVRFPPLLRIESGVPADFQDMIRDQFPLLEERVEDQDIVLPPVIAKLVGEVPKRKSDINYLFKSEDETWTVSLTKTFLALSTNTYLRWEEFKDRLKQPLAALHKIYKPAFFTRIGLRYRDVILRSELGLAEIGWSELLQPHIAGSLSDTNLSGSVRRIRHELIVELGNQEGSVQIRHGLKSSDENGDGETSYVIDSDFYFEGKKEITDAIEILDGFNRKAGRLFRWCITDKLHHAMEPQQID